MYTPSGDQATESRYEECPRYMQLTFPVRAFQMRTVLSLDPDAIEVLSGDHATVNTLSSWP